MTTRLGRPRNVELEDLTPQEVEPAIPATLVRTIGRAIGYSSVLAFIVVWLLFFRPQSLGGPMSILGVSGSSMYPTFEQGDFLVVRDIGEYHVGNLIVYRIPEGDPGAGDRVVHRIVGGDATEGFVMQGDNNANVDQWRPTSDDVVGEVWVRVPHVAGWILRLRDPKVTAAVIGLVAFMLMLAPDRSRTSMWKWLKE